jgi:MlaA lipoprotein
VVERLDCARIASGKRKQATAAAAGVAMLLLCGGCASAPPGESAAAEDTDSEHDPGEPVNRAIFKANVAADHAVMRPVAQAYVDHVPEGVRKGIHNVVQNLKAGGRRQRHAAGQRQAGVAIGRAACGEFDGRRRRNL